MAAASFALTLARRLLIFRAALEPGLFAGEDVAPQTTLSSPALRSTASTAGAALLLKPPSGALGLAGPGCLLAEEDEVADTTPHQPHATAWGRLPPPSRCWVGPGVAGTPLSSSAILLCPCSSAGAADLLLPPQGPSGLALPPQLQLPAPVGPHLRVPGQARPPPRHPPALA